MRLMSSTCWEGISTTIRNLFHTFMFCILKSTYLYRSRGYFFLNNYFFFTSDVWRKLTPLWSSPGLVNDKTDDDDDSFLLFLIFSLAEFLPQPTPILQEPNTHLSLLRYFCLVSAPYFGELFLFLHVSIRAVIRKQHIFLHPVYGRFVVISVVSIH